MPPRARWQINDFRQYLIDCDLQDMGFHGEFTWCNNREEAFTVKARLDRACCTTSWAEPFPLARVTHEETAASDHQLIWVDLEPNARALKSRQQRLFRFEATWTKDGSCVDVISSSWNSSIQGNPQSDFMQSIQSCRASLLDWNKNSFGNIVHQMKMLYKKISSLK
ncbi:UNVERIFIED_CONTAM: hypothetical protein Slati_1480800 [Sesamum latifolium]|uniref:Endonuclease/exonuclease/phosphatase domain-containing protein n=1 Tax=Sesamum latifolium TaxID=2727402 RepID=A0AAW2X5W5_9LAMI